jgi:hypothetical protein
MTEFVDTCRSEGCYNPLTDADYQVAVLDSEVYCAECRSERVATMRELLGKRDRLIKAVEERVGAIQSVLVQYDFLDAWYGSIGEIDYEGSHISIAFGYWHCGEVEYKRVTVPAELLDAGALDVAKTYYKSVRERLTRAADNAELAKSADAREKREREEYERLRKKFEKPDECEHCL